MYHKQLLFISFILDMTLIVSGLISPTSAIEFKPHDEHTIHMHPPHIPDTPDLQLAPNPINPWDNNDTSDGTNLTE